MRFVVSLCKKLFGIEPAVRRRKTSKTLVISLASTTVVDFLVGHGLARGNKLKNGLKIPDWILKKRAYRRSCLHGLVDTDGCLFIHGHRVLGKEYKNIGLTFTSYSPDLVFQTASIFEEFGIIPHITRRGRDVYLYRAEDVRRYLRVFGSSNDRIHNVYRKWRDARVV